MNLLGTLGTTILTDIDHKTNVLVRGIPGTGVNTFIREITSEFRNRTNTLVINLFVHESDLENFSQIEKLILEKLRIENPLYEDNIVTTAQLYKYLTTYKLHLLIIVNKLAYYKHPLMLVEYLESLCLNANNHISLLISAHLELFTLMPALTFIKTIHNYIFKGFIETYDAFYIKMEQQFNPKGSTKEQKQLVFENSLGHGGLIIANIKSLSANIDIRNISLLMKNEEILRRLLQTSKSIEKSNLNLYELVKNRNYAELELLGLAYNKKTAKLVEKYALTEEGATNSLYDNLTKTEEYVFKILQNNKGKYLPLEQILFLLGDNAYEKGSDWSIYKHINNLNKKLKVHNIGIENKRAKGYRLVEVNA